MNAINDKIENPLFFASFFGAALFPLAALAAHYSRRPRSGRFWLIALACVLYIGGSFLLTSFVNVPLNNQLATVSPDAPARVRSASSSRAGSYANAGPLMAAVR